jgi:acetylornithine deacetylase/succinyl-diaminopimelate desuccinylase-like protein
MTRPYALLGSLLLVACADTAPLPATTPEPAKTVTPPPTPPPPVAATPPPAASPEPFDVAYRHLLDAMVRVDTSHGNETTLLEPIAARYRELGVPVQILESAPGRGNLIARLKGSGQKRPLLLLAHVDVVPVEGQPWTVPPFEVTDKDGFLWGRGVNDDKAMAAAIVTTTLELARDHTPLSRDVIVALTSGEETGGGAGAHWLVDKHKELLDAVVALNEGGGITLTDDGTKARSVGIGVSEKLYQTFHLVVRGKGGHSSVPPTDGDPVTTLARGLVKVGQHRFPPHVLPEVKASLAEEVAGAPPKVAAALRHVIASAPLVSSADEAVLSTDRHLNALIRTTCVATMLAAAPQDNVLPTTAEAQVNCRILPGETRDQVLATLKTVIGDALVDVSLGPLLGDGGATQAGGEVFDAVTKVTAARFPGVPVAASMGTGASDSRFLRSVGIQSYGLGPAVYSRPELPHLAHGADERTPVVWFREGGLYLRDVIRALTL